MITILIVCTLFYVLLIFCFCIGFLRVPYFKPCLSLPKTTFSVLIPFRNEAKNLPILLASIAKLDYPKTLFEVILINDNSNDDFKTAITTFIKTHPHIQLTVLTSTTTSNSPKKNAIALGITHAKNKWIVTTDADCIVPKQWLSLFNTYITTKNPVCIAAPVSYHSVNSFLKHFQLLDFLSLMGVTIGAFGLNRPFLCNGANLAYKKSAFVNVNGFSGNTHIASGDDIFLLEKLKTTYPKRIHYLKNKNAIVTTLPEQTIKQLVQQRRRWAAKTTTYNTAFAKFVGTIVFTTNFMLVFVFFVLCITPANCFNLVCCFSAKFIIDALFFYKITVFFNKKITLKHYPLASFLYPFFSIYIALSSQILSYRWKGRAFKK